MIYCINRIKREKVAGQRTAGKKAPDDIAQIVENEFKGKIIPFYEPDSSLKGVLKMLSGYFINISNWDRLIKKIKPGDWVIVQHPYEGAKQGYKKIKKCNELGANTIVLIHDISLERKGIDVVESNILRKMTIKSEKETLKVCKYIICHNTKMKQYLIDQGIDGKKIYCLEIFDYLCNGEHIPERRLSREVCVAGNLSKKKSGYLYKFIDMKKEYTLNLYGPNYEGSSDEYVQYKGVLPSDELPEKLEGAFGLVWDGNDINGCLGIAGEYLRINNPHKCSLYLAANLPVIIWEKAALADYIKNNNLGVTVDNLSEIDLVLQKIDVKQYGTLIKNVREEGKKIREGTNLIKVVKEITKNHTV